MTNELIIVGGLVIGLSMLLGVMSKMREPLDRLNKAIAENTVVITKLNEKLDYVHNTTEKHNIKLDEHEKRLNEHDIQLKLLQNEKD